MMIYTQFDQNQMKIVGGVQCSLFSENANGEQTKDDRLSGISKAHLSLWAKKPSFNYYGHCVHDLLIIVHSFMVINVNESVSINLHCILCNHSE